jgi:hypothetical protein
MTNTVFLMIEHYGEDEFLSNLVSNVNIAIAMVFTLEAVMKIVAFGLSYFKQSWNIFDFSIVLASILTMVL